MITERGQALLQAIVEEYVDGAAPVASAALVRKYPLHVSSATVRNDMTALEEAGYIIQPHTSAGRIPTSKGYRFYVDHFLPKKKLSTKHRRLLEESIRNDEQPSLKFIAKALALVSEEAVFVGFGPYDTYYTGVSYLFIKPEFRDYARVATMGDVIDHLDDVMPQFFGSWEKDPGILIGEENPLSPECSVIVSQYRQKDHREGVLGIFGPCRMDYGLNVALVRYARELAMQR